MRRLLTVLLLALLPLSALADEPKKLSTWERYTRIPIVERGHQFAPANATTNPILNDTDTYSDERDLMFFEWGTQVSLECVLRTCFCLTMDDDVTIGSGSTCGAMGDPNATIADATGGNACFVVPAGGRVDFIVTRDHWDGFAAISAADPPGYRDGYCAATDATAYYPCDANDDCVTSGGSTGTCTTPAAGAGFDTIRGLFIVHEHPSAATECSVRKDL